MKHHASACTYVGVYLEHDRCIEELPYDKKKIGTNMQDRKAVE